MSTSSGDEEPAPDGDPPPPRQGQGPPPPYGNAYQGAPYGYHPVSGLPLSDRSKLIAGLLQILLPFGIGRLYMGDIGLGVGQLLVAVITCGIGSLWSFIDGIIILIGDVTDPQGRPLRDGI